MKTHWIAAALLSSALVVGCGDRGTENADNQEPNNGAPAADSAEPPAAEPEPAPPAPSSQGAQSTAGNRPAAPRPSAPAASPRPSAESARADEPPPAPRRPTYRELTIPANTALPLELTSALSSETAVIEAPVTARLKQAVMVDGVTVLPAGTVLRGEVTDVERAGRVRGRSRLVFRFTEATVDGQRETVRTNPLTYQGEASKGEDAAKIGAGAGIGAVIGGIVGGGDGAAKGAAIGGAAGTGAVLATRGREVELPAGTDLAATLATPFRTQVEER